MIYLFSFAILAFIVLFMLRNRSFCVTVISYEEDKRRFNSLSYEEKLKELKASLNFRERGIKRWSPEDDKDWIEHCLKNYGKNTDPHYEIEKAGIERLKKEIAKIEERLSKKD